MKAAATSCMYMFVIGKDQPQIAKFVLCDNFFGRELSMHRPRMHVSFVEKEPPTYVIHLVESWREQNLRNMLLPLENGSNLVSRHVVDRMAQEVGNA